MVDDTFLSKCKRGVYIINTSRGQIIQTKALISALRGGQVAGAALDVFENEKPNTFSSSEKLMYSELYSMDNVVLTPHIAGWTHESLSNIADIIFEKINIHFENMDK
jgi:D-3-phosphoglycerate dehydrogenase